MLCELSIRNFAIIDDLHISFSDGLTILSGETGAGKSIIINAVNLLLGSRATSKLIRTGAGSAELEALFQITPQSRIAKIMEEHEYDLSEGLLIRRIISANDRHRVYINSSLATMQLLHSITENLASISGQHAHQGLLKEENHLLILDRFAGLMPQRNTIYSRFHEMIPLIRKLSDLKSLRNRQTEHTELLEFQRKEIEAASLSLDEDTALENERVRLKNSETLYQTARDSYEEFYGASGSIQERLAEIKKNLDKACCIDPQLSSQADEIGNLLFQVEDIAGGLQNYLDTIQMDENRLESVESRLDIVNKLKRKYGGSIEAVFEHLSTIEKEFSGIENLGDEITLIEEKLDNSYDGLVGMVAGLSEKRKQAARKFSKKVEQELSTLKMPMTNFSVDLKAISADDNTDERLITEGKAITESGIDRVVFMIAPNVGEKLKPLANIASGGELSRVVLALKAMMAKTESLETIVFDEVDAGIGGGVAEVVGRKLVDLSKYHQIVCITHLPQIAKFGDHHFKISKYVEGGRTRTLIKQLNKKERIDEIARMLGGEDITTKTIDHAKEMLKKV